MQRGNTNLVYVLRSFWTTVAFRRQVLLAMAGWWLICNSASLANSDIWKTATSGIWGTGSNWFDGSSPGTSDSAELNMAGTYTVTFNADPPAIEDLLFNTTGDNVTFTNSGAFRTLNVNSTVGGGQDVIVAGATLTLGKTLDPQLNLVVGDSMYAEFGGTVNIVHSGVTVGSTLNLTGGSQITVNTTSSLLASSDTTLGGVIGGGTLTFGSGSTGLLTNVNVGTSGTSASVFNVNGNVGLTGGITATEFAVGAASGSTGTVNVGVGGR
jgi:fibronectin-binding autotransporter adhesin